MTAFSSSSLASPSSFDLQPQNLMPFLRRHHSLSSIHDYTNKPFFSIANCSIVSFKPSMNIKSVYLFMSLSCLHTLLSPRFTGRMPLLASTHSLQTFGCHEVIISTTILRNVAENQLLKAGTPLPDSPKLPWSSKHGYCQKIPLTIGFSSGFPSR